MSLTMPAPTKHTKTGIYRLRVAIPLRLRATTERLFNRRAEFTENLGTREPAEAKRRAPAALARIQAKLAASEAAFSGHADGPPSDTQMTALAALWTRRAITAQGADPGSAADWEGIIDGLHDQVMGGPTDDPDEDDAHIVLMSANDRREATDLLVEHGLSTDASTVGQLARALFDARWAFASAMKRRAEGATTATPIPSAPAIAKATRGCTFDALLTGWALDRGWRMNAVPVPVPLYERRRTLARFSAFIGHDDASTVTKADAVRFKEDIQSRGLHASTVRNVKLKLPRFRGVVRDLVISVLR